MTPRESTPSLLQPGRRELAEMAPLQRALRHGLAPTCYATAAAAGLALRRPGVQYLLTNNALHSDFVKHGCIAARARGAYGAEPAACLRSSLPGLCCLRRRRSGPKGARLLPTYSCLSCGRAPCRSSLWRQKLKPSLPIMLLRALNGKGLS